MALHLRPYQRDIIDKVKADWNSGYTDVMVTAATGGGKTVIFLQLLDEVLQDDQRGLIIAHRKELIDQPVERIATMFPQRLMRTGVVMANQDQAHAQIVVATVQTLASEKRLRKVLANGPIDYLIIDEAHHAVAKAYTDVIAALKDTNPNLRHLGVTATPMRTDDKGLREVYQKESAHYGIRELVRMGFLAPPRWLAIQTGISLSDIRSHGSGEERDFNQTQLANVYETGNCFDLVVESHKKFASDRPSIAFTVSVEGAHKLAEAFRGAGIPAASADGTMSKADRADILKGFRAGEFQVLCNVALWTEGLDLPEISCVHQVRPTQSDGLYTQMIGRALRIMPNKSDALILDYAPVESRNIAMLGDVLGVEARKEHYIKQSTEKGEVVAGFLFDGTETGWLNGDPMGIISRTLDYLDVTPWRWIQPGGSHGVMVLGLGKHPEDEVDRSIVLSPPSEQMQAWLVAKRPGEMWHRAYPFKTGTFEELSEWVTQYAEKRGVAALAGKSRRWAGAPPSEGQVNYARRMGVYKFGMTKGEVADALTYKLAIDAVKRQGVAI